MIPGYDSALIAIFLIISALIIHHIALTAPNPPPKSTTRQYVGWVDRTLCRSMCFPTVVQKIVIWLLGVTEIASILFRLDLVPIFDLDFEGSTHLNANTWLLVGSSLIISGGILRWSCYRSLGGQFTFEVSIQKDHRLITSGVYGFVRHPSYSGMFMVYAGIFIWQGGSPYSCTRQVVLGSGFGVLGKVMVVSYIVWSVALLSGTVKRIRAEDSILLNEFGDKWRQWAEKVPYALVPYVF